MRSAESTVVAGTICCCVFGSGYAAEGYPTRPIRLIIPYSAGGAADVPGRIVAQEMSERLAQQLVVDNRPGAGSLIGAELAARATPDGYTLLLIANTHYVTAALRSKIPFRPVDDFTHITEWLSSPSVLVVHPRNARRHCPTCRPSPKPACPVTTPRNGSALPGRKDCRSTWSIASLPRPERPRRIRTW